MTDLLPRGLSPRDTAEALAAIVCELDGQGRVTWLNRLGRRRFAPPVGEIGLGMRFSRILHPCDRELGSTLLRAANDGEATTARELRVVFGDGAIGVCLAAFAPILDGEGVIGASAIMLEVPDRFRLGDLVGRSEPMRRLFDLLPVIARAEANVLVSGESGTGRETVARAIHRLLAHAVGPFVAIDCGALPGSLFERALAREKAPERPSEDAWAGPGESARARGRTLFLRGIEALDAGAQAALLSSLRDKDARLPRIIASTDRDLHAAAASGSFDSELLGALAGVELRLLPLRERREDILLLCDHFVGAFNRRLSKIIGGITSEAAFALLAWDFPGNARELEGVIEHAFAFCRGDAIGPEHLPEHIAGVRPERDGAGSLAEFRSFEELEAHYLRAVLAQVGGNRLEAARRLRIHKSTLFRKMKALGI